MRIVALFLFFVFFGFNAVLSASVLWQDDDSISSVVLQEEEEEDDEAELVKNVFLLVATKGDEFAILLNRNHSRSFKVDQKIGQIYQRILYAPPKKTNE